MGFAYSASYLSESSNVLFTNLGVENKNLHMTTCFDSSGKISMDDNINLPEVSGIVSKITHWNTPSGVYLVAEIKDCLWSSVANEYFHSIGAVEDLPHKPHITLDKKENFELLEKLKVLEGTKILFNKHLVKNKSKPSPGVKI